MIKKIRYKSKKNTFNLKQRKKPYLILILSMITIILSLIFINNSITTEESKTYKEKIQIDYTVCLEENEMFLNNCIIGNESNTFITSLIDTVELRINNIYTFDNKINTNYNYSIIGELILTKPNDKTSVIQNKKYDLINNQTLISSNSEKIILTGNITNSIIPISDKIFIDFNYFNEYVKNFEVVNNTTVHSELKITIDFNLLLSDTELNSESYITIPLDEQYTNININNVGEKINTYVDETLYINNNLVLIIGIILLVLSLITFIINIIKINIFNFKKDIYNNTIKKYLKEYDRMIITSNQPSIDEKNYNTKIIVETIEELIDAHNNTNSPIIYYEVIPNEKSYFIVLKSDILYKMIVSRKKDL